MSDEHNLLDYECDDQGEELLNQSEDLEEPLEQEEAVLEEKQPEDQGNMLACSGRDIFEDDLSVSQLVAAINTLTPVDPPVPARSSETEEALQPVPISGWVEETEEQYSAFLEFSSEVQDVGNVDPSFFHSSVEPLLGQGGSREEFKLWSHQSEPSDKVQEYVLEAQCRASHQATLDCISGCGSKP